MIEARNALYRIVFCADLTAAQSPVIDLGYMVEAAVHGGGRFLGLVSRLSLTRVELDTVNSATWPELSKLDEYMGSLFDEAWASVENTEGHDLSLGSALLGKRFTEMTALQFGRLELDATLVQSLQDDEEVWQGRMWAELRGLGKMLQPTLTAPVLPMRLPAMPVPSRQRPIYREMAA